MPLDGVSLSQLEEDTWGWQQSHLPPRMRLMCVGPIEPSWVGLTLQLDAEGCHEPSFHWVSTSNEALTQLRDESFDCVLISEETSDTEKSSGFDGLSLLQAIRASGCDDPLVLVSRNVADDRWAEVCHANCELLVTSSLWESLALVPMIKRAVSRVEVMRENHRLVVANHRRLVRERDEADHLFQQQRQIIEELEALAHPESEHTVPRAPRNASAAQYRSQAPRSRYELPSEINKYYHELLRTYVIMGSGNLGSEIAKLSELLSLAGLSPREALDLHLERVESLVQGLGNRSTRHIMARADLLVLELVLHLGECYKRQLTATPSNQLTPSAEL